MSKTGWKRRLMAGLLCATLVFDNLSISASAAGSADAATLSESAENAGTEEATTEVSSAEGSSAENETGEQTETTQETTTADETDTPQRNDVPADNGGLTAGDGEDEDLTVDELEDELLEAGTEPTEDTTTVKMVSDAGSFVGNENGWKPLEIKGVNRNNAKWVEFKPATAGTYHIYTTNDGTNTYGDPLVGIYKEKVDKVEKEKAAKQDDKLQTADNDDGHEYKNFYATITVSKADIDANTGWFIFAGSKSSETDEQTKYELHAEKAGPIHGGEVLPAEAADRPVNVSDVSQYRYRWLSFTAPEDGI